MVFFSVRYVTPSSPGFYYRSDVWYTMTMEIVQNYISDVSNDVPNYILFSGFLLFTCPLLSSIYCSHRFVFKHSESISYFYVHPL